MYCQHCNTEDVDVEFVEFNGWRDRNIFRCKVCGGFIEEDVVVEKPVKRTIKKLKEAE